MRSPRRDEWRPARLGSRPRAWGGDRQPDCRGLASPEVDMDVSLVARVLWQRRVLRGRERWTRRELAAYQGRQEAGLREFAVTRSPFYRRFHEGLGRAPLG